MSRVRYSCAIRTGTSPGPAEFDWIVIDPDIDFPR